MSKFLIKVLVDTEDAATAEKLRDEIVGACEDAHESGDFKSISADVGDVIELDTAHIREIAAAAEARFCDEDINIDSDAYLSESDKGAWVQGWLWVPYADTAEVDDEEGDD